MRVWITHEAAQDCSAIAVAILRDAGAKGAQA
jgi:hypothetical protein